MLDLINNWAVFILAISIASERFVTIFKTIFPKYANDNVYPDGKTNLDADKKRRLVILLISFIGGWLTCILIGSDVNASFSIKALFFTTLPGAKNPVFSPLLGLLASGGSALWGGVVQYTSAAKDAKKKAVIQNIWP